jgi:hypothetical protein
MNQRGKGVENSTASSIENFKPCNFTAFVGRQIRSKGFGNRWLLSQLVARGWASQPHPATSSRSATRHDLPEGAGVRLRYG